MARPRLILDVSNLTAHYSRFVRTGIQEVVYRTLLEAHSLRREFREIEIILLPFLPRPGKTGKSTSTLLPYADTPEWILREIENSLQISGLELWGLLLPRTDAERLDILRTANWIHFQGLINIGPIAELLGSKKPSLSITVYDLIPILFPEYTPAGIAPWFAKQYLPSISNHAAKAMAISQSTARDLRENSITQSIPEIHALPLPFDPISTDVIDRSILQRLDLQEGHYLVYVGSLEPRKNLAAVIDGLEAYYKRNPESDLRLVWVGSLGWKNDWILRKLKRSPIQNRIIRPGYLNDRDLDQLVRLSLGNIMLSQYEGFGLPVAQAFSRGVPIITNYSSSLPEACLGDALFCDPSDSESVAQAIERSFTAPVSRFRRESVEAWDWKAYTRALIQLITDSKAP